MSEKKLLHQELTEKIIGCAYRVHNQLGFGFQESVYKKSMVIELTKQGLNAKEEVPITVYYDNQPVGDFFADIVVEDIVIIELKSIQQLASIHEVQLVNYLVATKTDIGLRINFGSPSVEVKRIDLIASTGLTGTF
jgi:GxxExxY protein